MAAWRLYKIAHWAPASCRQISGTSVPESLSMSSELTTLSGSARIPPDLGIVVQDHVQQGIMDLEFSVVFDETQFAESVHKKAHARSRRADHLRQRFLTKISHDRLRPTFLAKICKQKEKPGKALFASFGEFVPALPPVHL